MRGKGIRAEMKLEDSRITPAHAGKSSEADGNRMAGKDHPRPCGEKAERVAWGFVMPGSPPPMRGKESPRHSAARSARITPAHAGKSIGVQAGKIVTWDHPRPCGEKPERCSRSSAMTGSPPPMRGKGKVGAPCAARVRITPAHAGKSRLCCC